MIIDILTGDKSLKKIRNRAMDFANRMYDPTVYNPQADVFRRQGSQGIEDDSIRQDFLAQLFRQQPQLSAFGGNQAAAIAGSQLTDMNRSQALGDFESNLAAQELQAMERGRLGLAGVQTQQLQTEAQREAAIAEAEMEYEAERSSRRQALLGQAINLGAIGMTGAFKPGFDAIKGSGLGLLNTLQGNTSTSWFDFEEAYNNIGAYDPNSVQRVRRFALNFNDGGTVPGPDVDEDVVPTMLTPGEEVINKESAEAMRGLLKEINENPEFARRLQERIGGMERDITESASRIGLSQMDFGDFYQAPTPSPSPAPTTPRPAMEAPASIMELPDTPEVEFNNNYLEEFRINNVTEEELANPLGVEEDGNFLVDYFQLGQNIWSGLGKIPGSVGIAPDLQMVGKGLQWYGEKAVDFWSAPFEAWNKATQRRQTKQLNIK